jgi:hypothetical protein
MARPDVPTLILCAASVRSLAQAAIKVGIIPFCIDFFGDSDLRDLLDQAIPDGYRRLFSQEFAASLDCQRRVAMLSIRRRRWSGQEGSKTTPIYCSRFVACARFLVLT